jgi:hypothetical protein
MKSTDIEVKRQRQEFLAASGLKIRALEKELEDHESVLRKSASNWAWAAIELGKAYREVKDELQYGEWREWVEAHTRKSLRMVQIYMQMEAAYHATPEAQRIALLEVDSIQGFLQTLRMPSKAESAPAKVEIPVWSEGSDRLGKMEIFLSRHPVREWPEHVREAHKPKWKDFVRDLFTVDELTQMIDEKMAQLKSA